MVFKLQSENCYLQCSKGHCSKIIQSRVMVLALCILCRDVLYLCKNLSKYHKWYSSYSVETVVRYVKRGITPKLYKPELWL